jgi:hypothetical protein
MHTDLEKLWTIADTASRPPGTTRDAVFEPIGLILSRPPKRATYASTPRNTVAFAWTGGDGVHFDFLTREDDVHVDSPVLLVAPTSFERPYVVVGRNLRDFLALGVGRGFFELERLTQDADGFFASYPKSAKQWGERESERIEQLRAAFAIEPWAEPMDHFKELQSILQQIEPPAPEPPSAPLPSPAAFWQAQLDRERARPADERDPQREAHLARKVADLREGS